MTHRNPPAFAAAHPQVLDRYAIVVEGVMISPCLNQNKADKENPFCILILPDTAYPEQPHMLKISFSFMHQELNLQHQVDRYYYAQHVSFP
jgi:hypothetical protein